MDLARGLAVLGMFTAHLGREHHWIFDGRPAALFALLAGVSLGFMASRPRGRIAARAGLLYVLGAGLMMLGTPVAVILPSYGVMFALALPFLRARPTALLASAAALLLVMPPMVAMCRVAAHGAPEPSYGLPLLTELAVGYYPALSWLAYLLIGLTVFRLGLADVRVQAGLVGGGVLLAAAGYGLGAGLARLLDPSAGSVAQALVSVAPHSDSGPELLGNAGVALAVLGLCLLATRLAPVRAVAWPVAAVGSMSLTVYSLHVVYIAALGSDAVWHPASNLNLWLLIAGSLLFATVWRLLLGKGPLERLLGWVTAPSSPVGRPSR